MGRCFRTKMMHADNRIKLTNDALTGIRVCKYYNWEEAFREKIDAFRVLELIALRGAGLAYVFVKTLTYMNQVTIPIVLFYCYMRLGHSLNYVVAFTVIQYVTQMLGAVGGLPHILNGYVQASASILRIRDFFNAKDVVPYVVLNEGKRGEMNGAQQQEEGE